MHVFKSNSCTPLYKNKLSYSYKAFNIRKIQYKRKLPRFQETMS